MNKKVLSLVLCLMLAIIAFLANIFTPKAVECFSLESIDLTAKGAVVMESSSKRVLLEKNMDEKLPMASTTKIMTALIALENTEDLDEVFATDNRAVGIEGTSIYLKNDEHLSMRHLLLGLMLSSGNDAALAIAYKVGGSVENFVELMNKKVSDLGLHNTHFDNPHGLDSVTHYTSAYDLAYITCEAMKNENFREIVKQKFAQIPGNQECPTRFLRNKHKLLQSDMNGCEGVKTGFTDNARRCCVTSCFRNGMRLVAVVLNCQNMFEESHSMLETCYEQYAFQNLLEPNKYITSIMVENGANQTVKTNTKEAFQYPLKVTELDKINSKCVLKDKLIAPVKADEEVGEYKIYFDNNLIFSTKIYTMEDVETKDFGQKLKDIVDNWC